MKLPRFPYPARRVSEWLDTASDPMLAVQSDPRPLFVMVIPTHGPVDKS